MDPTMFMERYPALYKFVVSVPPGVLAAVLAITIGLGAAVAFRLVVGVSRAAYQFVNRHAQTIRRLWAPVAGLAGRVRNGLVAAIRLTASGLAAALDKFGALLTSGLRVAGHVWIGFVSLPLVVGTASAMHALAAQILRIAVAFGHAVSEAGRSLLMHARHGMERMLGVMPWLGRALWASMQPVLRAAGILLAVIQRALRLAWIGLSLLWRIAAAVIGSPFYLLAAIGKWSERQLPALWAAIIAQPAVRRTWTAASRLVALLAQAASAVALAAGHAARAAAQGFLSAISALAIAGRRLLRMTAGGLGFLLQIIAAVLKDALRGMSTAGMRGLRRLAALWAAWWAHPVVMSAKSLLGRFVARIIWTGRWLAQQVSHVVAIIIGLLWNVVRQAASLLLRILASIVAVLAHTAIAAFHYGVHLSRSLWRLGVALPPVQWAGAMAQRGRQGAELALARLRRAGAQAIQVAGHLASSAASIVARIPVAVLFALIIVWRHLHRSAGLLRADKHLRLLSLGTATMLGLTMCASPSSAPAATTMPAASFRLIAGSGFSTYEPMLKRFAQENGVSLEITYKGSLDIMRLLQDGSIGYDAIWDADSLWTSLGDPKQQFIRHAKSITCSPVVFGVKKSIAQSLGWIDKHDVRMQDILTAIETRKLRTMMTSATQSNSGASAYFGFLYAFADNPDVLSMDNLRDSGVREKIKRILGTINRTSESSGWLRDLFISQSENYDAMFNYESHVIFANQEMAKTNREPLYIIYPLEGLGIADFPLSFVNKNNTDKEPVFLKLQQYLLSDAGQQEIASKGRRIGPLCDKLDPALAARSDWGVDPARTLNKLRLPVEPVIWEALNTYQTTFRKSSFTIYCLDFSGSMAGNGERQLKQAMHLLLDQQEAEKYLLQASPDDITMVLTFDNSILNAKGPIGDWTVAGNDPDQLSRLYTRINNQRTGGGTDIYTPVSYALDLIRARGIGERIPAIILMTDGQSNSGSLNYVKLAIARTGLNNVPVNAITFGDADPKQLQTIADLTSGRVFDGTKDLVGAFRNAKGNN